MYMHININNYFFVGVHFSLEPFITCISVHYIEFPMSQHDKQNDIVYKVCNDLRELTYHYPSHIRPGSK